MTVPIAIEPGIPAILISASVQVGCTDFIETGTYHGHSVDKALSRYKDIWSIELNESLATAAQELYQPFPHVHVYHGDSVEWLGRIIPFVGDRSALCWLDAHDEQCPLLGELEALAVLPTPPLIAIDDIEDMGPRKNYPSVMQICEAVYAISRHYSFQLLPQYRRGVLFANPTPSNHFAFPT